MFAIGLEPTGSKDPFALRRAANGVIKILADSGLPLNFEQLYQAGDAGSHRGSSDLLKAKLQTFFAERLEFYLRDVRGFAYDVVKATLAAGADDVRDAIARAEALTAVRGSEDFAAISAAFKRIKNILRQAAEKKIAPAAAVSAVAALPARRSRPSTRVPPNSCPRSKPSAAGNNIARLWNSSPRCVLTSISSLTR